MSKINFSISAELNQVSPLISKISNFCRESITDVEFESSGKINEIELVMEEIIVNIVNYAYIDSNRPAQENIIDVQISVGQSDPCKYLFLIQIKDQGIAFNPLEKRDPNTSVSLEEREIGGLGIFFVKQLAQKVEYRREDDKNIIILGIDIPIISDTGRTVMKPV